MKKFYFFMTLFFVNSFCVANNGIVPFMETEHFILSCSKEDQKIASEISGL